MKVKFQSFFKDREITRQNEAHELFFQLKLVSKLVSRSMNPLINQPPQAKQDA